MSCAGRPGRRAQTRLFGVFLGGPALAALMTAPALAGTCNNAAPPYDIPAQAATVFLDTDCAGVGGTANVTGDVDGGGSSAVFDDVGNQQDWAVVVAPGISVTNLAGPATVAFNSPNGSVDNSGIIQNNGGGGAILYNDIGGASGPGNVTNRNGGQILAVSTAMDFQAGGTLVNEAGGLIQSSTGIVLNSQGFVNVTNAGTINAPDNDAISGNSGGTINNSGGITGRLNFFTAGTIEITNTGTLTGDTGNQAVRVNSIQGTVITSGAINAGAGSPNAITFGTQNDTLELQSGFSITGNVLAGTGTDTLRFGGTGAEAFDLSDIDTGAATQQYQAFDTFNVTGGTWTFSNATTVDFAVNGGRLEGNATFGDLTANNGGTIAPGNSVGTTNTANATFNAGSTYEVELNDGGFVAGTNNDLVNATGTATINGGTVNVLPENGTDDGSTYTPGTYTIITAAGGVAGTFAAVTDSFLFLDFALAYDANNVYLNSMQAVSFSEVAQTPNQVAVAGPAEALGAGNAVYDALVVISNDAQARAAFDALSGEVHASTAGILLDESRYLRNSILGRLTQAAYGGADHQSVAALGAGGPQTATRESGAMALGYPTGKPAAALSPDYAPVFWTRGFGSWADFESDGNAASADRDLGGFVSGLDFGVTPGWRAGFATGYTRSDIDVDARLSSADADSYYLAGYAGGAVGRFQIRGGASWTWHEIETSRAVSFPGFFDQTAADYGADTAQVFGEIAKPILMRDIALEPFAGLAYAHFSADGFQETGGAAALQGSSNDEDIGYFTLGLRAARTIALSGGGQLTPWGSLAWQHAWGDTTPEATLAFASGGTPFDIAGVPIAEDALLLELGTDMSIGPSAALGISYSGQIAADAQDHGLKANLTVRF